MPGRIFIDMDGVLVNYVAGVCRAFGVAHRPYPFPRGDWDFFAHPPLSKSADDVAPVMDHDFYAGLDWLPDGEEIVSRSEKKVGAANVYLLTAPWDTPGCYDGKLDWVRTHLPRYARRVLVGTPKEACSFPGAVLLDDSESNGRKFASAPDPGTAVLVPRPWNARHAEACPDTFRVFDLDGLFDGYADGRPARVDDYLAGKK